jgi:ATP-dependent DNA helicase RecG
MDAETLRQRLRGGENLNTEFKVAAIHPDDLAAALVAFANTSGGAIIFGASDKGEIVGVENIDGLGKTIDNVARHNCLPAVTINYVTWLWPLPKGTTRIKNSR